MDLALMKLKHNLTSMAALQSLKWPFFKGFLKLRIVLTFLR